MGRSSFKSVVSTFSSRALVFFIFFLGWISRNIIEEQLDDAEHKHNLTSITVSLNTTLYRWNTPVPARPLLHLRLSVNQASVKYFGHLMCNRLRMCTARWRNPCRKPGASCQTQQLWYLDSYSRRVRGICWVSPLFSSSSWDECSVCLKLRV